MCASAGRLGLCHSFAHSSSWSCAFLSDVLPSGVSIFPRARRAARENDGSSTERERAMDGARGGLRRASRGAAKSAARSAGCVASRATMRMRCSPWRARHSARRPARDLLRCGNVLRPRYSVAPNRCLRSLGVSRWRPVRGELWAARYLLRNKVRSRVQIVDAILTSPEADTWRTASAVDKARAKMPWSLKEGMMESLRLPSGRLGGNVGEAHQQPGISGSPHRA
jgi:hypothetical protein